MGEPIQRVYRNKKDIIIHNFIGGIAWGLGVTIGLAIVLTIMGFALKNASAAPFIGDFIVEVIEYINLQNKPQLVE